MGQSLAHWGQSRTSRPLRSPLMSQSAGGRAMLQEWAVSLTHFGEVSSSSGALQPGLLLEESPLPMCSSSHLKCSCTSGSSRWSSSLRTKGLVSLASFAWMVGGRTGGASSSASSQSATPRPSSRPWPELLSGPPPRSSSKLGPLMPHRYLTPITSSLTVLQGAVPDSGGSDLTRATSCGGRGERDGEGGRREYGGGDVCGGYWTITPSQGFPTR